MKLELLNYNLTICKVESIKDIDFDKDFFFMGKTDEEISLVCNACDVPQNAISRQDGWKALRIPGELDLSLIGILSKIAGILADCNISIFAVSTYNTDYILVKEEDMDKAIKVLEHEGYEVKGE